MNLQRKGALRAQDQPVDSARATAPFAPFQPRATRGDGAAGLKRKFLDSVFFANEPAANRPAHDTYPVELKLMKARSRHAAAIGILIDIPPSNLNVGTIPSFVPNSSELVLHVSPGMLQLMVERGRSELEQWLEDNADSLKVRELSLTLDNNKVRVRGKVEETATDAEGTISGDFYFRHSPGATTLFLDGSDIEIDLDLPWWMTLVSILIPPVGLSVWAAKDIVENDVPDIAQKAVSRILQNLLAELGAAVDVDGIQIEGVPVEVYPDRVTLDKNALTAEVQILIQPISETLKRADYSKLRSRFVMFHLRTGRRYIVSDLADFMRRGLVEVPGYHEVDGRYIRANPDNTEANNLLKKFAR